MIEGAANLTNAKFHKEKVKEREEVKERVKTGERNERLTANATTAAKLATWLGTAIADRKIQQLSNNTNSLLLH